MMNKIKLIDINNPYNLCDLNEFIVKDREYKPYTKTIKTENIDQNIPNTILETSLKPLNSTIKSISTNISNLELESITKFNHRSIKDFKHIINFNENNYIEINKIERYSSDLNNKL